MVVSTKENGMRRRNPKRVKAFYSSLMEKSMKASGLTTRKKEKVVGYYQQLSITKVNSKTIKSMVMEFIISTMWQNTKVIGQ